MEKTIFDLIDNAEIDLEVYKKNRNFSLDNVVDGKTEGSEKGFILTETEPSYVAPGEDANYKLYTIYDPTGKIVYSWSDKASAFEMPLSEYKKSFIKNRFDHVVQNQLDELIISNTRRLNRLIQTYPELADKNTQKEVDMPELSSPAFYDWWLKYTKDRVNKAIAARTVTGTKPETKKEETKNWYDKYTSKYDYDKYMIDDDDEYGYDDDFWGLGSYSKDSKGNYSYPNYTWTPKPKSTGFLDKLNKSDTLVIHCADKSTDMLAQIYEGKNWDVLNDGDIDKGELHTLLQNHDRIVCLGHGTGSGLINVQGGGYTIGDTEAPFLKDKKLFIIWCNADKFFEKHNIGQGQYITGNMPSEVWECRAAGCGNISAELMLENITYWSKLCADIVDQCFAGNVQAGVDYLRKDYLENYGNHPVTIYNAERSKALGTDIPLPTYEFKGKKLEEKDYPVGGFDEAAFLQNPTPEASKCPKDPNYKEPPKPDYSKYYSNFFKDKDKQKQTSIFDYMDTDKKLDNKDISDIVTVTALDPEDDDIDLTPEEELEAAEGESPADESLK